ncbi:hypothetical protein NW765_008789 [Fusarium oxysporum]|nr:hypothetical protein NW765_008789 [Fusarium oxysporum]
MIANSTFRQGIPCDAVGLGKSSTSLLAALEIKEVRQIWEERSKSLNVLIDCLKNERFTSQLGQIHKDLHGVLIGKDDETFHRELLSTRAAPEQEEEEEEEEEEEVRVELLDLEDANDRIMKRINAN